MARAPQLHPPPPIFVVGGIPASLPSTRSTLDETTPIFSGSAIACPRPACQRHCALAQSNQKGVTPAIANSPRRGGVRNLAPLPRPLCSVCLFGFTPDSYNTHKPMISQSHHHHHYQLTRDHYRSELALAWSPDWTSLRRTPRSAFGAALRALPSDAAVAQPRDPPKLQFQ